MSEYGQLDRQALDAWITREPPEYLCEVCGKPECEHTDDFEVAGPEDWGA